MNKKIHTNTPIQRCRTKRIDSNKKIKLQGIFKARVNLDNISDETVSIENDGCWASLSEGSKQTATINEVFQTATGEYSGSKEQKLSSPEKSRCSGSKEQIFSSPENSRCSETHRSLWSLDHLFENSDDSATDGWVKAILSTPEKCTSSDSDGRPEKKVFCSTRYDSPEFSAILPDFKELDDVSSIRNITCCNDADQQHHNNSELESKLLEKNRLTKKCSGKINFPKVKRKNASQIKKTEEDLQSNNSAEVLLERDSMPTILQSFQPSGEIKEAIPQTIYKEDLGETPQGMKVKHPRRKVFQSRRLRKEKSQRTINASKLSTSNQSTFQESSSDPLCSTRIFEPTSGVPMQSTPFHKSYKAPSLRIHTENADISLRSLRRKVLKEGKHSKGTSAAKLVEKEKSFHKRKSKEDRLKEKSNSAVNSSVSTKDLITPAESESIKSCSLRISEKNSDKFLEETAANDSDDSWTLKALKLMKNKKPIHKRKSIEESLEDEVISTPSSTVVTEDFIEAMDTSSSSEFSDKNSEDSEEKFLEEMGLYESDSLIENEQPKLKTKNNFKNRHGKYDDASWESKPWESKSLQGRIQEYKEYLKTIPICDLSLKK